MWSQFWLRALCVIGLAISLSSCGLLPPDPNAPSSTPTKTIIIKESDTSCNANAKNDCGEPDYTHCADYGKTVSSAPITTFGGAKVATLELRISEPCRTAWGRVTDITLDRHPLHIDLKRPSDGASTTFYTTKGAPTTGQATQYGLMMNYDPGCIIATAYYDGEPSTSLFCLPGYR